MSRIGQPKGDHKAEFWTAVGGRYRVSLDYVVTIAVVPGRHRRARTGGAHAHRARRRSARGGAIAFRAAPLRWHRALGRRPAGGRRLARAARARGVGVLRARRALRLRRRAGRHAPVRVPGAGRRGRLRRISWCPAAASSSRSRLRSSSPTGIASRPFGHRRFLNCCPRAPAADGGDSDCCAGDERPPASAPRSARPHPACRHRPRARGGRRRCRRPRDRGRRARRPRRGEPARRRGGRPDAAQG